MAETTQMTRRFGREQELPYKAMDFVDLHQSPGLKVPQSPIREEFQYQW
jgi:hypothetical protein